MRTSGLGHGDTQHLPQLPQNHRAWRRGQNQDTDSGTLLSPQGLPPLASVQTRQAINRGRMWACPITTKLSLESSLDSVTSLFLTLQSLILRRRLIDFPSLLLWAHSCFLAQGHECTAVCVHTCFTFASVRYRLALPHALPCSCWLGQTHKPVGIT